MTSLRLFLRDLKVMARMTWRPLLGLLLVFGAGTLVESMSYPDWTWDQSLHSVIELAALNPVERYADAQGFWAHALYFAIPILVLVLGLNLAKEVFVGLFSRRRRNQEWEIETARTLRNHIVICGLGTIGTQVVLKLVERGMTLDCIAIELDERQPGVAAVRDCGVPVILGDSKRTRTLLDVGILKARLLVLAGDDDHVQVATLLKAQDLRKGRTSAPLQVVFRCFDSRLIGLSAFGDQVRAVDTSREIAKSMLGKVPEGTDIARWEQVAIVGLGKVGHAVARHLRERVPAARLTLVDRNLAGTWARNLSDRSEWSGCRVVEKDLLDFLEDGMAGTVDAIFVTTGDDMTFFLCCHARNLGKQPVVVRTKHQVSTPGESGGDLLGVYSVNTTEITAPILAAQVFQCLGMPPSAS